MILKPMQHWTIAQWRDAYQNKKVAIEDLIEYVKGFSNDDNAWISLADDSQIRSQIQALSDKSVNDLPLFGIPFAVKDNIDIAGFPTTAACPDIQYVATEDATVVKQLKAAGAIVVGKTNLDQFATGLVGVRSPYGAVNNSFNPQYISGGSSSGSSVVVANGLVPFSLGTDTAGSGRVPAGHNNIVGLKPTKGWFSTKGLIPACRTQDVISIFALTVEDAWQVAHVMQGYDELDDYSRKHPANVPCALSKNKIAIPKQLEFYGDKASEKAFDMAVDRLKQLNFEVIAIDFTPFNQLASALYNDAWVAERTAAVDNLVARDKTHPVIHQIIDQGDSFTAVDTMRAEYRRAKLARQINQALAEFDALMVPTAPTIYTIAEVEADPLTKNSHMGAYTNFVNLADLSAIALPNVIREDGLPSGITLIAPAWHDTALAQFGVEWQALLDLPLGNSKTQKLVSQPCCISPVPNSTIDIAVVGAHLTIMPLNYQLIDNKAVLIETTKTTKEYRLYALANTQPLKPALERVAEGGEEILIEIWRMPMANFGAFVALIPPPLGIGSIKTKEGKLIKGFICEPYALNDAVDISQFGGWKAYINHLAAKN